MTPVPDCLDATKIRLRLIASFLLISLTSPLFASIFDGGDAAKGKEIFNNNCSSCHKVQGVLNAPELYGIETRWKAGDALMVKWITNPNAALATGDPYIVALVEKYKAQFGMMTAQAVTEAEIKDIFAYVKTGGDAPASAQNAQADSKCITLDEKAAAAASTDKGSGAGWWIVLGVVLAIIAVSASNISKSLRNAMLERAGKPALPELTYGQSVRAWMWKNVVFVSLVGVFVFLYLSVVGYKALMNIGVYEGYYPSQPIAFSHAIHNCQNEIDCQYCHSSASKSKHAGIPSANVCMNCHKAIREGKQPGGTAEIQKIYDAIGFDPKTGAYIPGYEEKPIMWNKVHNLPDHVSFNHQTHVAIAGIDCKQCHGPVQTYTTGRMSTTELTNSQEDVPGLIKLTKQTLTMGWCLECHNKATVDLNQDPSKIKNGYYLEMHDRFVNNPRGQEELRKILADDKATVRELGGWECGKCHY